MTMSNALIAPSILSADFARLGDDDRNSDAALAEFLNEGPQVIVGVAIAASDHCTTVGGLSEIGSERSEASTTQGTDFLLQRFDAIR